MLIYPSFGKRGFTCKEDVHKSICLPENYSKFELPFTEKTNQIAISIDIDDVLRINDGTYSITFSTYFNVEWNERRLSVQPDFGASQRTPNSTDAVMVPMNMEFIKVVFIELSIKKKTIAASFDLKSSPYNYTDPN